MVLENIINNFNTKTCGFGTFHLEEPENRKPTLSVKEHQEKLLASLDLSGLDKWSKEMVEHAH